MWTPTTRRQHSRAGLRYRSDLTDAEWAILHPFLPPEAACGRKRAHRMREIVNAICYVLIAERWLLGRLRHTKFHSLAELNTAITEFCRRLNDERVICRVNQTRRQLLEMVERQALKALPAEPYALAEWRIRRVGID